MDELERWTNETFARRVGACTLSLQSLDRLQSLIDTCPTRTLGQHSRALPSLEIAKPDETTTTATALYKGDLSSDFYRTFSTHQSHDDGLFRHGELVLMVHDRYGM